MVSTIKKIAKQKMYSMQTLEYLAGVTAISRWDEHVPSVDKVARVAKVLGVTVDELLKEEETK